MPDPTPAQKLGLRIYVARQARGWSIHRLATEAGTSASPVVDIEQGRECHFSNAARLAAALGIPLDEPEGTP